MTLHDVLQTKGWEVFTTSPDTKLSEVVRLLVAHNCGSLVVLEDEDPQRMVGIVTERDILRACAASRPLDETPVEQVMTREVLTGHVDKSLAETMGLMTERRIRHLPLVEGKRLIGIISIGDVVKAQHDRLTAENHHLKNYIQS
ncbi:MAG: CBS domain-containing protein [Pirellulales bacterium]